MADYVRVTDKETGHKYTVTRARLEANPNLFRELKQPAADRAGRPLPPEYKTTDAPAASDKQAGDTANTEKEK